MIFECLPITLPCSATSSNACAMGKPGRCWPSMPSSFACFGHWRADPRSPAARRLGAGVIPRLSRDLHNELPEEKGFFGRNIKRMLAFYRERIPPPSICATSCGTNGARLQSATGCGTFPGGLGSAHTLGAPHRAHGKSQGPGCPPLVFIAARGQGGVHLKTTTPGLPARGCVFLIRPRVNRHNLAHD